MTERDAFGNPIAPGGATAPTPQAPPPPPLPPTGSLPPTGVMPGQTTATIAVALGIAGLFVFPFLASIPAIILGRNARREIDAAGRGPRGMASAAIALGWTGVIVYGLMALVFILLIASIGSA